MVGVGANGTAVTGADVAGGLFVNPGFGDSSIDAGAFGSFGPSLGFGVGGDVFAGFVMGDPCKLEGQSANLNLGLGPISLTALFDAESGDFLGATIGFSGVFSFPPLSASAVYSTTGILSVRSAISALLD